MPCRRDADCHVASLLAMTVGGGPCTRSTPAHLLHVIARSGAAAPRRGKLFHAHYQADTAPVQTARYDSTLGYSRRMLNYIAKNYTKAIGLDDIAREMGLTKSYICRLFRQHTGSTIIGYVNRLRCYQAIYLMESGASVTEAALSVGFNDYNYFSRVFKKVIGCRPSDSMTKISEDIKS